MPSTTEGEVRVVVVDGDPESAARIAETLERGADRFRVRTATGVDEVLDRLPDVDCVVSAYDLPGETGIALLEAVRDRDDRLPVVLYAEDGSEELASEAIAAGVTEYLPRRPTAADREPFVDRILEAVDRYRSRRPASSRDRRVRSLLEHSNESLVVLGPDGEYRFVGPATERLFGYSPDDLLGDCAFDYVHPDDRDRVRASFDRVVERSGTVSETYRYRHADGSWRWLESRAENRTDDPEIGGVVVSSRDRTAERTRERELRTRTRAIEEATDGIAIHEDGEYVYVNQSHADVYGYDDPEAFLGEPWTICYDEAEIERFESEVYPDLHENGSWRGEATGRRKDGSTFPQELSLTRLDDGGIVCVVRDITERTERERELREATDQLQAVLDTVSAAIFVKDADGRYLLMNDNCREILGVETDDMTGLTDDEVVPEDVAAKYQADDRRVLETGEMLEVEEVVPTTDGTRTHLTRKSPILDDAGEPYAVCAVSTDITERKERRRELERQNERLEEFASIVSHDLRNPLNIARSYLELARSDHDGDELEDVAVALERMHQIVERTLSLARSGRSIGDREPVALDRLAAECWENVDTAAADVRIGDVPSIDADPERVRHLLENLFRNAVEHGGDDVTVRVGPCEDGFFVEDDGVGLPADVADDALGPTHSMGGEAAGLGLAIVNRIAEAHGWEVAVADGTDGGARFEITGIDAAA